MGEVIIGKHTRGTVTCLLGEVRSGNRAALDEVFELLYDEIQALARRQRRRWGGNHTLDTHALVHEAYLKLVGQDPLDVESRAHFCALASRAVRHILCNYARLWTAQKRGGGLERVTLDERRAPGTPQRPSEDQAELLAALGDALDRLEDLDSRQSNVVECRFFGGMTVQETATALGVSPRTVKREWAVAQAWLHRELEG
jgi:RNA polymerase sigma factor (TIGR02999 family)